MMSEAHHGGVPRDEPQALRGRDGCAEPHGLLEAHHLLAAADGHHLGQQQAHEEDAQRAAQLMPTGEPHGMPEAL